MNRTQLTTQIGYRIRTASRNFISNDEILSELNRSIDRLSSKVDLVRTIRTTTIAFTGDGTYAQPTDFKKPIKLYDRSNHHEYKFVSRDQLFLDESSGVHQYALEGKNFAIESTIGSATLTLVYYSTHDCFESTETTLQKGLTSANDIPALQTRLHDYFVEDVSAVLFRKERKYDDYKIARSEANDLMRDIEEENPTQEETVVPTFKPYSENYD